jgi:hypothetical protein
MKLVLLAFLACALPLAAQVERSSHSIDFDAGFLGTAQSLTWAYPNTTYGFTALMEFRRSTWMGLDIRGQESNFGDSAHTLSFEAGPRIAPRYGRVSPYAAVIGGPVHQSVYTAEIGGVAGVDLNVTQNVKWRVLEVKEDHIFNGQLDGHTLDHVERSQISSGIVIQINYGTPR